MMSRSTEACAGLPKHTIRTMNAGYADRRAGGRALATALASFARAPDTILVALPRGGVPVAHEVARELGLPLKLLFVRRIRLSGSDLSVGSVSMHGMTVLSRDILDLMKATDADVDAAVQRELVALAEQEGRSGATLAPDDVRGRTAIIIDDGLATGSSMAAAAQSARAAGAARVVAATPVASPMALSLLDSVVDSIICPLVPEPLYAVGIWYEDFSDVSDAEVESLLSS
jgi:predicted phosphoribosyltransferase